MADDLGSEIDRLWAKVGSASAEGFEPVSAPSSEPVTGREAAWEAVSLLKRQHRHETRYWAEVLEAKERAARAAQERAAFLELEVNRLREKIRSEQERFLADGLDNQAKAETAGKALEEGQRQFEREQQALRDLLEQTRQRLAAEQARSRQERENSDRREQQHLLDLKELQALTTRREGEAGKSVEQNRRQQESLKEAKNALEKTLSELFHERQVREESDKERDKALKKVDEVQKHFEELSKIWEEERAQWRELWDRERSTWETQRAEFAAWEENLRKERESWLAEVKAKEQDQARFTERISESLKESSEATSKLSALMKGVSAAVEAGRAASRRSYAGRLAAWAAAAAMAAALGFGVWSYAARLHFKLRATRAVDLTNPTALAYDGNFLWIAEYNGRLLAFDPQNPATPARAVLCDPGGAYRPVAVAIGGGNLWSLDSAQARIVRHKAEQPDKVLWSRPAPGPAPTALAYDGQSLWSFDAANKTLYRHGSDEGSFKAFALDQEVVATAMAWSQGQLWLVDAKTRKLLAFKLAEEGLRLKGRYDLADSLVGLAPVGSAAKGARRLWVLAGPSAERPGHVLIEYGY